MVAKLQKQLVMVLDMAIAQGHGDAKLIDVLASLPITVTQARSAVASWRP
jgi:hypothetical protein